jgi:SAM-dependent methyltransferase
MDLRAGLAMCQEDLTDLSFDDDAFSMVFCSHVLEHIPDDAAAIGEIARVLEPDGIAVILVPVRGDHTDEEPLDDPEERFRRYGLEDHVRFYGLDVIGRLERCFDVEHRVTTEWSDSERVRLGLGTEEHAFLCRQPSR